jgi:hypothetical protein
MAVLFPGVWNGPDRARVIGVGNGEFSGFECTPLWHIGRVNIAENTAHNTALTVGMWDMRSLPWLAEACNRACSILAVAMDFHKS